MTRRNFVTAVTVVVIVLVVIAIAISWQMQRPPSKSGLISEQEKNAFITSAKQSCINNETNNPANRRNGITDAAIGLYCQCAAEQAAEVITPDEMQYIATNHAIPKSFRDKTRQIAQTCRSVTLPPPAH